MRRLSGPLDTCFETVLIENGLHGANAVRTAVVVTFPCRSPGFDCCCNFAWGLTPFQWSEAGLLGQPSLGTCAGAHSVALGLQGMSGISCLIALILPMFAASSGRYLMMLMGRCSCSFGIPIRRPFVIVSLPFLVLERERGGEITRSFSQLWLMRAE